MRVAGTSKRDYSYRSFPKAWLSLLIWTWAGCHRYSAAANEDNIRNPFYRGCLHTKLGDKWKELRVCTSNDLPEAIQRGYCQAPTFSSYMEIRISPGNWFSATALSWIVQIILSEVLGVPASIESGGYGQSRDFYDPQARLDYDEPAREDHLIFSRSLKDADCRRASRTEDNYQTCSHFIPEGWGNPLTHILNDDIEPPQGVGILGTEAWFMTKFTAQAYPEFVSYHGMVQPESRQKLAQVFKRPTTWADYCSLVSKDNCTTPDDAAKRAPDDQDEGQRMFVDGLYTGHFRFTEKNNCTLFPDTCTGHIANYPCGWSSNMEINTYHLGIPLDPNNGPNGGPNGYSQTQLMEIWDAANATRSHLIMMWWYPEPLYQKYQGTDAEFQRVVLPPYTLQCAQAIEAREATKDECSDNITIRVGEPEEACEWPAEPLRKLIAANLADVLNAQDVPEAERNPAYDMMRLFQMDELQLGQLFDLESSLGDPRDAVCTWLTDNLSFIDSAMPVTFPRVISDSAEAVLSKWVLVLGILAAFMVAVTALLVYQKREKPSVKYAQLDFLFILLAGALLVSVGAILNGVRASDASCLAGIWFVHLGYTLELVPLIIKVAALNKLMTSAQRFERVKLSRRSLHGAVALVGLAVCIVLAVWSATDPPRQVAEHSMSDDLSPPGERLFDAWIVDRELYCSSGESDAWEFAGLGWNTLLLLAASVLAFQTRNLKEDFNESRTLAFLIYSHAIFVVLRISTYLLPSDSFEGSTLRFMRGLLYAVDQIAACLIYFLPKLFFRDFETMDSRFDSNSVLARINGKSGSGSVMSTELGNPPEKNSPCLVEGSQGEKLVESHSEPVSDPVEGTTSMPSDSP